MVIYSEASILFKNKLSTIDFGKINFILSFFSGTDGPSTSRPPSGKPPAAPQSTNEGYESEVSSILGENAQDDSDDSTATRIIEKSNLFPNFERPKSGSVVANRTQPLPEATEQPAFEKLSESPKEVKLQVAQAQAEPDEVRIILSGDRPKTSYVAHDNEAIVIRRPKTTGALVASGEKRDFKLTLEIEPVDQITIRTPPKTPEKVSLIFDMHESTGNVMMTSSDQQNDSSLSIFEEQQLSILPPPSPGVVVQQAAIPLPPPPTPPPLKTPIVELPPSPTPSRSISQSPSRSNTKSPSLPFEETPIVRKMEAKPSVPHFNSPLPQQQPGSDSTYESTTDTEAQKKPTKPVKKKEKAAGKKVERPRDLIVNCFLKLQSSNWEEVMEVSCDRVFHFSKNLINSSFQGLEAFVFLIKHHADLVDANLHLMTIELCKQIKNLRSQVARSACQVASKLFLTHRRTIEPEAEELTAMLLNRTSDTNKFLRADAISALECMCENLPVARVIHLLSIKGATHHNGLVKTATAKLLAKLVDRIGGEKVFSLSRETRDKLILTAANLLTEGSLETRSYAKQIFRQLAAGHPNAAKIFLDVIPSRVYRNIEKTLKSILIFWTDSPKFYQIVTLNF